MEGLPISEIIQALAIPLAFIIGLTMALVEFAKKVGLEGNACIVLSLCLGVVFGGGYYVSSFGLPSDFAGWFLLVVVALIPGLAASGVYDFIKST